MVHSNTVEFSVKGSYALFSDVITKTGGERFSYPVPTYSSLKGILDNIYWKPTFKWIIDEVRVLKPIRMCRKGMRPIDYSGRNQLAYYTYLHDVEYQVKAHFVWNPNRPDLEHDRDENKHFAIAKRAIQSGGRRNIYLGTSECFGYVTPCKFGEGVGYYDNVRRKDCGFMLHSTSYADNAVLPEDKDKMITQLWRPVMRNGVIKFIAPEECKARRYIKDMEVKPFAKSLGNFSGLDEFEGGAGI